MTKNVIYIYIITIQKKWSLSRSKKTNVNSQQVRKIIRKQSKCLNSQININKLTCVGHIAHYKHSRWKSQAGMELDILFFNKGCNFLSFFLIEINNSHKYSLLSKSQAQSSTCITYATADKIQNYIICHDNSNFKNLKSFTFLQHIQMNKLILWYLESPPFQLK